MKLYRSIPRALALSCLITLGMGLETPLHTSAAKACGGFFCSLQQPVDQAAERILFTKEGDEMVTHVQIQYTGPSENFSWILPVPSVPELGVGSDILFQNLRNTTRPQFSINVTTEGECRSRGNIFFGPVPTSADVAQSVRAESASVEILSQENVGPFETVVLQGDDPATVKQWLIDNGYDVPPDVDPLLTPYIENKMPLLALKLQKGRNDGDLQPITMRYKAEQPMIPIQLTAVAATEDMDIQVWVLGEKRAIPLNYPHVKINESRVDWLNGGQNYRSLVTEAMNEAGGQGFVTEYAGNSNIIDTSQILPEGFQPERLRLLSRPLEFARMAQLLFDQLPGQNQERYLSFIERYIAKPTEASNIDDESFYNNLYAHSELFNRAEITVNTAAAIQELEETFVQPGQEIKKLFQKHGYLTALYTTLSPAEMTRDPIFDFRSGMTEVSAQRMATGIRRCHGGVYFNEAPIDITTPGGLQYAFQPPTENSPNLTNNPTQLPAAAVIETLSVDQEPIVLRDETARINTALKPGNDLGVDSNGNTVRTAAGCSCHSPNTPVPISAGAGEGLSYAAFLLGFWGWRKWKQNQS